MKKKKNTGILTLLTTLVVMLLAPAMMAPSCWAPPPGVMGENQPSLYCDARGEPLKTPPIVGWVYQCGDKVTVVDTDPSNPAYEYGDYIGIEAAEKCSGAGFNGCTSVGPYSAFECEVHWPEGSTMCGNTSCVTMAFIEDADVTPQNVQGECERRVGNDGGTCQSCKSVAPNSTYLISYFIECVDAGDPLVPACVCGSTGRIHDAWSCFQARLDMVDECRAECESSGGWKDSSCYMGDWSCDKLPPPAAAPTWGCAGPVIGCSNGSQFADCDRVFQYGAVDESSANWSARKTCENYLRASAGTPWSCEEPATGKYLDCRDYAVAPATKVYICNGGITCQDSKGYSDGHTVFGEEVYADDEDEAIDGLVEDCEVKLHDKHGNNCAHGGYCCTAGSLSCSKK